MDGFVPPGVVARLRNVILPRAFQTDKDLGNTQVVTFHRDNPNTGADMSVSYEVLVIIRQGGTPIQGGTSTTVSYVGYTGELQRELGAEFKVHRDDRFELANGTAGRLTSEPVEDLDRQRVPFVIER